MSFFDKKKKQKELKSKDQFFIFMGRWFEKFTEERAVGCRLVEDISTIPQEYLDDWAGWKPKPLNIGSTGFSNSKNLENKSSKFF